MPGLDQGIDDQAGRMLDGDRQFGRRRHALKPGQHVSKAGRIVAGLNAGDDPTCCIDDANGMGGSASEAENLSLGSPQWGAIG